MTSQATTRTSPETWEAAMADPWLRTTISVPASRCGPPGMVNGGWVSGTVAGHLGSGPVEVLLRNPTPLDSPLELRAADNDAVLMDGTTVLVAARRVPAPPMPPAPVTPTEALAAEARFEGHDDHPFPGCFVCGTERADGDGLRLFSGPVAGRPGAVAGLFVPRPGHGAADGRIPPATVWAALDCPTAWPHMRPGAAALLGRIRGQVFSTPVVDQPYVVVGEATGEDGRKLYSRSAVFDRSGSLVGVAEATWISVSLGPGAGSAE
jgi:hypothetical protein